MKLVAALSALALALTFVGCSAEADDSAKAKSEIQSLKDQIDAKTAELADAAEDQKPGIQKEIDELKASLADWEKKLADMASDAEDAAKEVVDDAKDAAEDKLKNLTGEK